MKNLLRYLLALPAVIVALVTSVLLAPGSSAVGALAAAAAVALTTYSGGFGPGVMAAGLCAIAAMLLGSTTPRFEEAAYTLTAGLVAAIMISLFSRRRRKLTVAAGQTSATVDAARHKPVVAMAAAANAKSADQGSASTGGIERGPAEMRREIDSAPVAVETPFSIQSSSSRAGALEIPASKTSEEKTLEKTTQVSAVERSPGHQQGAEPQRSEVLQEASAGESADSRKTIAPARALAKGGAVVGDHIGADESNQGSESTADTSRADFTTGADSQSGESAAGGVIDDSEASASSPETISLLDVVADPDRSVADRFARYPLPDTAQESSSAAVFGTKLAEESGGLPEVDAVGSTPSSGEVDARRGDSDLPPLLEDLNASGEAVDDSSEFESALPPPLAEEQEEPHLDLFSLTAHHPVAHDEDGADEAETLAHGFPPAEAPVDESLYDFSVDAEELEVVPQASTGGEPVEITLPPVLEDEAPVSQTSRAQSDLPPWEEHDFDDRDAADRARPGIETLSALTLLIIDRDGGASHLRAELERQNMTVEIVEDLVDALVEVETLKPDAVLVDCDSNDVETLYQAITSEFPRLRILFALTRVSERMQARLDSTPLLDFIQKPYGAAEVIACLRTERESVDATDATDLGGSAREKEWFAMIDAASVESTAALPDRPSIEIESDATLDKKLNLEVPPHPYSEGDRSQPGLTRNDSLLDKNSGANSMKSSVKKIPPYTISCPNCRKRFDVSKAEWCNCVSREHSLQCPSCLNCFCRVDTAIKQSIWMSAPEALAAQRYQKREVKKAANSEPGELTRPLVLVVEDERDMLALVSHVVRAAGYGLIVADNGQDGLQLARRYVPELVIADALLPKLDGREMCRLIKEEPATAASRTIIMTGVYTYNKYKNEALRAFKVDEYLFKPFKIEQLDELLKKYLSQ